MGESYKVFSLVQLVPISGFSAVYADIAADGKLHLSVNKVDALAIARVEQHRIRDIAIECEYTDVVGLELLSDGEWSISNEFDNFCGLMRDGGDPKQVDFYSEHKFYEAAKVGIVVDAERQLEQGGD